MFKEHPRGLATLFFTEMWERFSFYGMRALLVLYMVHELAYADEKAYAIYGAYGALVYATPVVGGVLADRLLGYRLAIILGAAVMAAGHFLMAVQNETAFYGALALLILGNGIFKPNISSLVGKLYPEGDDRRDAGFTIFYMGINFGALAAPLVCGVIGETFGWHYGFGLAGLGMLLGLLIFWRGSRQFRDTGAPPDPEYLYSPTPAGFSPFQLTLLATFLSAPLIALLVNFNQVMSTLLGAVGVAVLGTLFLTAVRSGEVERDRLFTLMALFVFSTLFWAFFEQAGSSITLFTERNVNRHFFGREIPTSVFQAVNPLFIVVLAPFFAGMWMRLRRRHLDPSTPAKFGLGMLQLGLGFGALVLGAGFLDPAGMVPLAFLILGYLLHTTGELCLSPVGLATVTRLSPPKIVGFVMGAWFLSSAFAHHIGGLIARLTSTPELAGAASLNPLETLPLYSNVFGKIALVAMGAGLVLFALKPVLKRWMHGVQ